jgi:hypothetical protein
VAALGADFPMIPQGIAHVILRTPIGIWAVDPAAPPDPTVSGIMQALGIGVELKLGGLTEADLHAPSLPSNLALLLGGLALGGYLLYQHRKR